jgi:23S rRNA-/tRNA-specific pseudouridylate synthase
MHQIRVHAAHRGHPVLGDQMYGDELANIRASKHQRITRQLLHAYEYSFTDREDKPFAFSAPLPKDFIKLIPA